MEGRGTILLQRLQFHCSRFRPSCYFRPGFDLFNFWQELYVRRGVTPKYDLVQIEGQVHEPTFKYRGKIHSLDYKAVKRSQLSLYPTIFQ